MKGVVDIAEQPIATSFVCVSHIYLYMYLAHSTLCGCIKLEHKAAPLLR